MTYVYGVVNDDSENGDGMDYFATKNEAVEYGRMLAAEKLYPVDVYRFTVADDSRRKLLVGLLNHQGWAMEQAVIASLPAGQGISQEGEYRRFHK